MDILFSYAKYFFQNEVISEAKKLVGQKIRTEWKDEDLKHKIFSGGISNVLIGVYKDGDKKDMVLVRLYGHKTDVIIDRDAEIRNMTMFSEAGIGAKLFATLGNGLAYAFVPGETMTSDMAKDPKVNQALIEMFVRMHKMKVKLRTYGLSPINAASHGLRLITPALFIASLRSCMALLCGVHSSVLDSFVFYRSKGDLVFGSG